MYSRVGLEVAGSVPGSKFTAIVAFDCRTASRTKATGRGQRYPHSSIRRYTFSDFDVTVMGDAKPLPTTSTGWAIASASRCRSSRLSRSRSIL